MKSLADTGAFLRLHLESEETVEEIESREAEFGQLSGHRSVLHREIIGALLSAEIICLKFLSEFCVCSMNVERKLPGGKMNRLSPCIDFSPFFKKYIPTGSQSQSSIVSFIIFQPYGMFSYICQRNGTKSRCCSMYPLGWLSLSPVEHF